MEDGDLRVWKSQQKNPQVRLREGLRCQPWGAQPKKGHHSTENGEVMSLACQDEGKETDREKLGHAEVKCLSLFTPAPGTRE